MLGYCKRKNILTKCYDFSKTKFDEDGNELIPDSDQITDHTSCAIDIKHYIIIGTKKSFVPKDAIILKTANSKGLNYFISREKFLEQYECPDFETNKDGFLGNCKRKIEGTWLYDFEKTKVDEQGNFLFHELVDGEFYYYDYEPNFEKDFSIFRNVENKKLIQIPRNCIIAKNKSGKAPYFYTMPYEAYKELYYSNK